jgi:prepilin-type N-terminal cleavage/methylation domain-containing protein
MTTFHSQVRVVTRRGFTLIELLVAMTQLVLIIAILSEAFVAGIDSFRNIKAIADLGERLRGEAIELREDVAHAHFEAVDFILETTREGSADLARTKALRLEYEAIGAQAKDLEARLRSAERDIANPIARRLVRRTIEIIEGVKLATSAMIDVLDLIDSLETSP